MGFLINGQPLAVGRPFTDADGTQYPSNWLRLASEDEKAAIGITWEADPAPVDNRFYWDHDLPSGLKMSLLLIQTATQCWMLMAFRSSTKV